MTEHPDRLLFQVPGPLRGLRPPSATRTLTWIAVVIGLGLLAAIDPALALAGLAGAAVWVALLRLHYDATTALTAYVALLFIIPGRWVVPSLGAIGTPASLVALACGFWWFLEAVRGRRVGPGARPIRILAFVLLVTVGTAVVAAYLRPLDPIEANGAMRGLIRTVGLLGVTLVAADGIRSRHRLDVLFERLLDVGMVFAAIGMIQFFTDYDPVTRISVPGLGLNTELAEVAERSVLDRVASTALHPIEFGAVLAVLLPLALHRVLFPRDGRRVYHWIRFGMIAFAIPLSVSRTAVVALAVVLLAMWPVWVWRRRINVLIASAIFLVVVRSLVPGLLGTFKSLFTNWGNDPSVQNRQDDLSDLWVFIGERPFFGRGFATFDPSLYFFVDNQIMLTLVSGGIVGLIGVLAFVFGGASIARQAYWHAEDAETRHLGASLAAAIMAAFATFFTFDALSFPIMAGLVFLLIGLGGALWRLEVAPTGRRYRSPRSRVAAR